jgi:hypothetical protein
MILIVFLFRKTCKVLNVVGILRGVFQNFIPLGETINERILIKPLITNQIIYISLCVYLLKRRGDNQSIEAVKETTITSATK